MQEIRLASENMRALTEEMQKFPQLDTTEGIARLISHKVLQSEPSVFAADEKPGLFMGSTQSNVGADANNLESQIYTGFGLKK